MGERLRLGFLGGGLNSAVGRAHFTASRMDGKWELVAGAFSRQEEVNRATGDAWGIAPSRLHPSVADFLKVEAGELDAVVVLTPTPEHGAQIEALLDCGFDVISEKALVGSSLEAGQLARKAEGLKRFLAVTFNYSGYPMIRELRRLIAEGELGRIVALQVVHTHHLVDFLLQTSAVEVVGVQSHHGRIAGVADYVSALAQYPDDVDVSMWFGKTALGNRNGLRVRIFGEKAAAEWYQLIPEVLTFADDRANTRIIDRASPDCSVANQPRYERFKAGHPAGFLEAFANLYWDMAEALLEHRRTGLMSNEYVYGATRAQAGLRMLEAIACSAADNRWVVMDERED